MTTFSARWNMIMLEFCSLLIIIAHNGKHHWVLPEEFLESPLVQYDRLTLAVHCACRWPTNARRCGSKGRPPYQRSLRSAAMRTAAVGWRASSTWAAPLCRRPCPARNASTTLPQTHAKSEGRRSPPAPCRKQHSSLRPKTAGSLLSYSRRGGRTLEQGLAAQSIGHSIRTAPWAPAQRSGHFLLWGLPASPPPGRRLLGWALV